MLIKKRNLNVGGWSKLHTIDFQRVHPVNVLAGTMIMHVQWVSVVSSCYSRPHEMVLSPTPFLPAYWFRCRKLRGITRPRILVLSSSSGVCLPELNLRIEIVRRHQRSLIHTENSVGQFPELPYMVVGCSLRKQRESSTHLRIPPWLWDCCRS